MRIEDEPGTTFNRGELFHIPFQSRHRVKRQRFSIPGLPCLYLGGSLYVCWQELRRPRFESVHVEHAFDLSNHSVYSISRIGPYTLRERIGMNAPMVNDTPLLRNGYCAKAVCSPLMVACAIRRKHGDSPFIAEYIIPQLILQWITENDDPDLDGISYSSVDCETHVEDPGVIANIVFPAREIMPSGYCTHLRRKFAMTTPVSWNLLASTDYPLVPPPHGHAQIAFVPGHPIEYFGSEFFAVEGKLLGLPTSVLP